ncbi:acyltransferase family protein [Dyella caseinilytica]|uniref:Acyltransferase n=1 Tax=Dyella caseinilytica TaxID=1849581 RepID=A0ABX7GXE8_9GAMM|nr:acyltransferase family protein [Dyella caseinilytica]QRN54387.1 acyltransferase [Dyella caseinilytica]GFZ93824.1 acyltransferase [Dyella caseinilytica]
MTFRKDINGLRAVAVVLVLLFHGGLTAFPSGFIGVDVFFVISGFLITSIVRADLAAGKFSFPGFYVRRLWRIQVALLAVIAATFVIAAVFYLPDDFNVYFKSAMQTMGLTSNYFFAKTTTAYAATGSQTLLLLHTWSLSVEWQWYLVMPVAMWLLYRYASPLQTRIVLLVALLLAAVFALRQPVMHGDAAYFWFSGRIFEFLFGALLAVMMEGRANPSDTPALNLLGLLGLALIFGIAMKPGVIVEYPNRYAILLSAACVVVLWMGGNERSWVSRVLSLAPVVFVGDISYSLYLWHWPIFATWRYLELPEGAGYLLLCFALTFVLAYLSYRFIEEPYRRLRPSFGKSVLVLVVLPLLAVAAVFGVAQKYAFFPGRFGPELAYVDSSLSKYEPALRRHCLQGRGTNGGNVDLHYLDVCVVGKKDAPVKSLMIGDSYSNQYWNFIGLLSNAADMSVASLATPSCLALPGITLYGWDSINYQQYRVCEDRTKHYYSIIQSHKFKYVILGENWGYYEFPALVNQPGDPQSEALGQARMEAAIRHALDIITSTGAIPVVIKSAPTMPGDFDGCFYQHFKLRQKTGGTDCTLGSSKSEADIWYDHLFERLQASYPTLVLIDPRRVQCSGNSCMTTYKGVPIYRDTGHMSDYGSYQLGQLYLQSQPNPFTGNAAEAGPSG